MQNKSSTCGYGLSSQVGYLFERQRAAMRQNSFARARNVVTKRKNRDSDDSDEELFQQPPSKKKLLEGLKRMRVSSPPSSHSHNSSSSSSSNANVSDNFIMTDSAMNDDDDGTAQANEKALVPLSRPRRVSTRGFSTKWSPTGMYSGVSSDLAMPAPTDPFCRAIVPFDSTTTSSIPRGLSPRIELVESDEEQDAAAARRHDGVDSDEESFVRFEEIHDDEDEPMEID